MAEEIAFLLSVAAPTALAQAEGVGTAALTGTALPLENIHNLRDLGGLQSRDGRRVRAGRLFRSANPGLASQADIARLQTLGLDRVIDFRAPQEKSAEEGGFADSFDWLALPVLEGSISFQELLPRLQGGTRQDMDDFMLQAYRDFPVRYQAAFAAFMKEAETGRTLLYHCSTGKDRTGFATLLLLSAFEVPAELILANYLESNHWNQRLIQGLLARLAPLGIAAEVAMPLLEVRAGYLEASLQTIEQEWGSTADFLRKALSVDVERLQANYLEEFAG